MYNKDSLLESTIKQLQESVSWSYYDNDKMNEVEDKYLPNEGQGDTMASQIVTAINKLIYRYYNDGDRFDGYSYGEDITSYANWLVKYVPGAEDILTRTDIDSDSYENVLKDLADKYMNMNYLTTMEKPAQGSIYDCDGPFYFEEEDDDYEDEEW